MIRTRKISSRKILSWNFRANSQTEEVWGFWNSSFSDVHLLSSVCLRPLAMDLHIYAHPQSRDSLNYSHNWQEMLSSLFCSFNGSDGWRPLWSIIQRLIFRRTSPRETIRPFNAAHWHIMTNHQPFIQGTSLAISPSFYQDEGAYLELTWLGKVSPALSKCFRNNFQVKTMWSSQELLNQNF